MKFDSVRANMSYEYVKKVAAEAGVPVKSMLAMSQNRDPFYQGTPAQHERGAWFALVYKGMGYDRIHLRRAHYWCVSQPEWLLPTRIKQSTSAESDGKSDQYMNSEEAWRYLVEASIAARYLGYVEIGAIVDNKNPSPYKDWEYAGRSNGYEIEAPDLFSPEIRIAGYEYQDYGPYHLEIWCEKSTMNDVLWPIARNYKAILATFEGEASLTASWQLLQRIQEADRPVRIFYISDFDPAGMSMPRAVSRRLEYLLQEYGVKQECKVLHVALNQTLVKRYNLPRTPIKPSETRAARFENKYGRGAVELDALQALHPGSLRRIVRDAMDPFFDRALAEHLQELQELAVEAAMQRYNEAVDKHRAQIEALAPFVGDIRQMGYTETDPPADSTLDASGHDQGIDWLFDTNRDYLAQLRRYRRH